MTKKLILLVTLLLVSIPNIVSLSFDFAQDSELVELSNYAFAQSVDTAWVRRYNGPGNGEDRATAIAVDDSGNVSVTGYSYSSGTVYDYATIKYLPNGDTAWVRRCNGSANSGDWAYAIAVDGFGNVYVGGGSGTMKYDPSGNQLWIGSWGGSDIALDTSYVYVIENDAYITIKYKSNGDTAWVRRYNGPENHRDEARAITVDDSGNVYVTGGSYDEWWRNPDYATIKYDSLGNEVWVRRYNGPTNGNPPDFATAIVVDDSGNVYVTGRSYSSGTDYDYCTIKYVQTGTGIKDETENGGKPSEFALSQNYPNPFNPNTTIQFRVGRLEFREPIRTTLSIYNILGQKVRTLVDEDKVFGECRIIWDGKDDSGKEVRSGIYFYLLKTKDYKESKKMILLK